MNQEINDKYDRPEPSPSFGPIKCPHCGFDGKDPKTSTDKTAGSWADGFRYLEEITVYREVTHVDEEDLHINALYETGDGYDDGANPRLECRACYKEFPIPEGLELYFD